MKNTETVAAYIASAPQWARPVLSELRRAIKSAAPKAAESISYKMPYYSQGGRVAYFAAFKKHCSFFWISAEDKKVFAKDLAKHKVVGSTLQIPQGTKVPTALVKKIVRSHVKKIKLKKSVHL